MKSYKVLVWKNNKEKSNIQKSKIINNNSSPSFYMGELEIEKVSQSEGKNRPTISDRISNREKIIQTHINPFMSNNNYIDDLTNYDNFLRPKMSDSKQ
tara:strand:+ start:724 stop:1017 length:294 start_codon:yes stop_codon:yes gene_type:complete